MTDFLPSLKLVQPPSNDHNTTNDTNANTTTTTTNNTTNNNTNTNTNTNPNPHTATNINTNTTGVCEISTLFDSRRLLHGITPLPGCQSCRMDVQSALTNKCVYFADVCEN